MGRLANLSIRNRVYAYKWAKHTGQQLTDVNCISFAALGKKLEQEQIQKDAEKLPLYFNINSLMGNLS